MNGPLSNEHASAAAKAASLLQYGSLYFLTALLTLHISNQPESPAALWYANAVGIGFLLQRRLREWPVALLFLELLNLAANLLTGALLATALRFGVADMLEILLISSLLRCFGSIGGLTPTHVMLLAVVAGVLGPAAGASLVTALHLLTQQGPVSPSLWVGWFTSSGIGTLSLLPAVLLGRSILPILQQGTFWISALICVGVTLYVLTGETHPLIFISTALFATGLWLNMRATALLIVLVSITMQWCIAHGWFLSSVPYAPWGSMTLYVALLLTLLPPFIFSVVVHQLRQREADLKQSEACWKFALAGLGPGVWDWNMQTGVVTANAGMQNLLGCGAEISTQELFARLHPDDRPHFQRALGDHLAGRADFEFEVRLLDACGQYRWLRQRGSVVSCSPEGEPLRMIGTTSPVNGTAASPGPMRANA